jgi:hypothetical protein
MTKKKYFRFQLLLFIILVDFCGFAQDPIEGVNVPNPLKKIESSFYPNPKSPIKSFIYIVDKDTISKSDYDLKGNEIVKLYYEGNKLSNKVTNKFIGALKTETLYYTKDVLQSKTTYKYDSNNNLVEWKVLNYTYHKNSSTPKTVVDNHSFLEYNKNNKIVKMFMVNSQNVKGLYYENIYDSLNNLVENIKYQWKEKFEYENDLLIRQSKIFNNDNTPYSYADYKYNDMKLLIESNDNYYNTRFTYDSINLIKINYIYKNDNSIQDIDLIYNDDLLAKVLINTSSLYSKPEFHFKADHLAFFWKKNELNKLHMEFLYDKYNNIVEIKYFIKDIYKYSKFFIYTYY